MSWKKRTTVAVASAALLATGGFAVANAAGPAPAEKETAPVTHDASTRSALEQELDALMAQVDAMESAAPDVSHDAYDDHGGDRPDGVSDDTVYDDNGGDRPDGVSDDSGHDAYDDHGGDRPDGVSDDTGYDDNGGDRDDHDDDDAWDDHGHDDDDDWDDD
jgi:ABC-type glycerol-3-phosphate transport system substrate-binding protein